MKTTFETNSLFKIYKSLFDGHHDACFALDLEGNFIQINDAAARLTGYSQEEALQMSFVSLIHDHDLENTFKSYNQILKGNRENFNVTIQDKQGNPLHLSLTAYPIYNGNLVYGIVGIAKPRQRKPDLENLLVEQNQILEMVAKGRPISDILDNIVFLVEKYIDGGLVSILLKDEHQPILHLRSAPNVPQGYKDIINVMPIGPAVGSSGTAAYYNRNIITADIATDLLWRDYRDDALKHGLKSCWSTPVCNNQHEVIGVLAIYYQKAFTPSEAEEQIISKANHLTSLVIQHYLIQEKINYLAYHDDLTGLPNKKMFDEKVNIAINLFKNSEGKLLGLMYFDLDRFKLINELLGYKIGDLLLKAVAKRITSCIRKNDIPSRQGSDEFTILLDHVSKSEINQISQRILDEFAKPFSIEGNEMFITPSIGISLFPSDGKNADELIRKADVAMYHAKQEGRNTFKFYSESLDDKNFNRLEIETELRKAIEKNEFILHYQPIVDLSKNEIKGVEALIRWDHPHRGKVPPDRFIPIAEETGMIIPIGEMVLKEACNQLKRWQESGLPMPSISVNISLRQFYQTDLVPMIQQIIKETRIDPKCLTIEITESMTMDVEKATSILHDLKNLGLTISIDDFGTGYSSLSYLKKFPIDYLKIDRSFIRDIATNKDDENIATTILLMAHNLGLSVIAEGVETSEQLGVLKQHSCNEAQGYLFSKPLSDQELQQFLNNVSSSHLKLRK
ncbi:sensor domain-containing protein [Bacillus sp. JJ1764]|uniref:sensor domain-containing protein n=1 Tax=Bacillus sp. JJ1764 TaxID=3122964 RepID=UPI002FFEBD51